MLPKQTFTVEVNDLKSFFVVSGFCIYYIGTVVAFVLQVQMDKLFMRLISSIPFPCQQVKHQGCGIATIVTKIPGGIKEVGMVRISACVRSLCCAAVLACLVPAAAQQYQYEDTLWIPVIFYDFHPVGAPNSDFEAYTGSENAPYVTPGMVLPQLGADRKPVPAMSAVNTTTFSTHLAQWFRPSGAGEANQFWYNSTTKRWEWKGLSNYPGGLADEWVGPYFNKADPMANVVIYDSLPFLYVTGTEGTYAYNNQEFFMLDGRGFGTEPANSGHNYSFTMEIHGEFNYTADANLVFDFEGDDDVWAFIDSQLVMDLGGVHGPEAGRVDLDTMGLSTGRRHTFDFFYAERHVVGSTIKITTNILTPGRLRLLFLDNDSILVAGTERDIIKAVLNDEAGLPVAIIPENLVWLQTDNPEAADRLSNPTADVARLYGEKAHRYITVRAEYTDPETDITLVAVRRVWVGPGAPDKVILEDIAGDTSAIDRWVANPVDTIRMTVSQDESRAYAVLRDRFNNYAGVAANAVWSSLDRTKVTVSGLAGTGWTGVIKRGLIVTQVTTAVQIQANAGAATPGTAIVEISNEIQVLPPLVNVPAVGTTLHRYEKQVSVTLTPQTEGSSIRYCINCSESSPSWIEYTAGTPIVVNGRDTTTLRAYAYIAQQGYLDSEIKTWQYYRVPPGSLPPRAVPGTTTYRGSIQVILQQDSAAAVEGPQDIYFYVDRTGSGAPAKGTANGWILYDGHTFTFSENTPVVLYAYAVNNEDIQSDSIPWTYTNTDWQGPVITDALYYLGNPPSSGPAGNQPDTLILTFDEPATWASLNAAGLDQLFGFWDQDNAITGAQVFGNGRILENVGDTISSITLILGNPDLISPLQDSVAAVVGALVDMWGNKTVESRSVIIKWGRSYDIIIGIAPNPADFGAPGQIEAMRTLRALVNDDASPLPRYFTLVKVESVDDIVVAAEDDPSGESRGDETFMTVYDALGNVVKDGIRAYRLRANPRDIVFAWDLRNAKDRMVGSGSYLGIITIKILGGGTKTRKVKLAVRH